MYERLNTLIGFEVLLFIAVLGILAVIGEDYKATSKCGTNTPPEILPPKYRPPHRVN